MNYNNWKILFDKDFWNFICCSEKGYDIVIDEYKKSSSHIIEALDKIKKAYLW